MPQTITPTLSDVFSEYIALRQSGRALDEVVEQLTAKANELPRSERHQLSKMVSTWEVNNGDKYNHHSKRDTGPQTAVNPLPDRQGPGPTPFGTRFLDPSKLPPVASPSVIRPIETPPAPTQADVQNCPNCGKKNNLKDTYCYSCGHILKLPEGFTQPLTDLDHQTRFGTAHFDARSALYLAARGVAEPFKITLRDEIILGRASPSSALNPDIDLAAFDAEKLGVSRLHAALKRTGDTVSIMDLQSSNRTYVNGQVMYPHEVRVLRNGDEIRLGKLVLKIMFRQ